MYLPIGQNRLRLPDWVHERAKLVVRGEMAGPSRQLDGRHGFTQLSHAVAFVQATSTAYSRNDDIGIRRRWPALHTANFIHLDASQRELRMRLEALTLAKVPARQIAKEIGLNIAEVQAYQNMFFDVRSRLNKDGFILHNVIRPHAQRKFGPNDIDVLWKLYGYYCGPHVLRLVIRMFPPYSWCTDEMGVMTAIQRDAVDSVKLKTAIAAKTWSISHETQETLLNAFTKVVELERTVGDMSGEAAAMGEHVQALLRSLPTTVAGRRPSLEQEDVAPRPDADINVELTADELAVLRTGGSLSDMDELARLRFEHVQEESATS